MVTGTSRASLGSRLVLLAVACVGAGAVAPSAAIADVADEPRVIAHKGIAKVHGEDTVEGQLAAIDEGASCVETDLRISRDGYFVQMHDTTVDRTTDGTGAIHEMTIDQIRVLRTDIGNNPVPTLEDSLAAIAPTDACLVLDITGFFWRPAKVAEMDQIIASFGMTERTAAFVANTTILRYVRDYAPDLETIWKAIGYPSPAQAVELGVDAVVPRPKHTNEYVVRRLHEFGLEAYSPVQNKPRKWRLVVDEGFDGLLTDNPGAFLDWYDDRPR